MQTEGILTIAYYSWRVARLVSVQGGPKKEIISELSINRIENPLTEAVKLRIKEAPKYQLVLNSLCVN